MASMSCASAAFCFRSASISRRIWLFAAAFAPSALVDCADALIVVALSPLVDCAAVVLVPPVACDSKPAINKDANCASAMMSS